MHKALRLILADWPLHLVLLITNWLPDNVPFLRLRGWLARPFLGRCGPGLRLGRNVVLYNPSQLFIGDDVYLAYGTWIAAVAPIHIESQVLVGPYCVLASSDHVRTGASFATPSMRSAPIRVGSGSWLASHVVITAGVTVGPSSLAGAGAVLTKDVPPGATVGGVPARNLTRPDPGASGLASTLASDLPVSPSDHRLPAASP